VTAAAMTAATAVTAAFMTAATVPAAFMSAAMNLAATMEDTAAVKFMAFVSLELTTAEGRRDGNVVIILSGRIGVIVIVIAIATVRGPIPIIPVISFSGDARRQEDHCQYKPQFGHGLLLEF
jgi:hypothetical protein